MAQKEWIPKAIPPISEIRGIKLEDCTLNESFESCPRIYGNVQINEYEKRILELPPKFGLLNEIDITKCIVETEKCLNQIRWRRQINSDTERKHIFDSENKIMDVNNLKATDLPYNTKVNMPKAVSNDEEIRFQNFKTEAKSIAIRMKKKSEKYANLDDDEKNGLRTLKQKTKEEEVICFNTDKSGRWAIDSKENYMLACEKHLNNGVREITCNEHDRLEKYLNCHMLALLRMMGLKKDNNGERIRNASVTTGNVIAPFYSLRKDHKTIEIGKEVEGPKTRGVCGAKDCLTMRLSHTLSLILKELIPENDTHCDSTEDLLAEIENVNNNEVNPNWKVGSLDIEALYPSLDIPKCSEIIIQELYNSDIQIKNINWKEVMLYLRYMLNDDQIKSKGLWQYCPTRKCSIGRPPTFIASGSDLKEEERLKSWIFKKKVPCPDITKMMFCQAIGILTLETITNHGFRYDTKIYKQEEGGATGLELVGVVASVYMCWWDKQLIERMNNAKLELKMYKRYVDDANVIVNDLRTDTTDEEVIKKVSEIANTIDKNIKSTYDYGSKYEDGRLPMLDLKLWIGQNEEGNYKILHTHYMKEVSSKFLIHEKSSHPDNIKFNTLVNEGLRILRNCSTHLCWEECSRHLQHFVHRMQFSGYDHTYRAKVMKKVLDKYDEKLEELKETGRMYKSRKDQYNERRKKKDKKKTNWYDREKFDGVLYVDVTENSEMMKEMKKACKRNKLKIKVVEKMSSSVKQEIQRSNPFKIKKCGREDCHICEKDMNIDCRTRGCVYKIRCVECGKYYIGQTCRCMYDRINEHFNDWINRKDGSVLFDHSRSCHGGEVFKTKVTITSRCFGDPTSRMISEAVHIDQLSNDRALNSKSEWNYVKLPKATIN